MKHCLRQFSCVVLGLSLSLMAHADVSVIVNQSNPIESLTHKDVQRLFLGRSAMFPHSKTKIYAVDHSENSPLFNVFYKEVINMESNRLKKYRAYYLFSGKGRLPLVLNGSDKIINKVAETENAISYIDSKDVSARVKVVFSLPVKD